MSIRFLKRRSILTQRQSQFYQIDNQTLNGIKEIQRLIKHSVHLDLQNRCICTVCSQDKPILNSKKQKYQQYTQSSNKSHVWLKKILIGITTHTHKTLKLFIPDILFIQNEELQIFSTNKKDYRIIKFPGTTPLKLIYHTMLRLRKQYKQMLQQNFRKNLIEKIDPKFMHQKYYQKILPTHFHNGDGNKILNANKSKFQKYVIHKNQKLIVGAIEQHKMNQKQDFCTLRYFQGTWQLLNQKQFQNLSLIKIPQDVVYVQSYIKSKQIQAICYSQYSQSMSQNLNKQLFKRAQLQVMVLLGGLSKYDQGYDQLQNFQDFTDQLMKYNPTKYAQLVTYKIIHFLSMVSSIYIRHIKIKWIINDIDNVYLQQIIQFDTNQISKRPIRFKLPPTIQIKNFYQDGDFFIQIHKQLKKKKEDSLIRIRQQLKNKDKNKNQHKNQHQQFNSIENKNKNNIFKRLNSKNSNNININIDNEQQKSINYEKYLKDQNILQPNIKTNNKNKYDSITRQSINKSNNPFSSAFHSPRNFKPKINNISSRYTQQLKQKYNPHKRSISIFSTQIITKNQKNFQLQKSRKKINRSLYKYHNTIDVKNNNIKINNNNNNNNNNNKNNNNNSINKSINKFGSLQY